MAGRSAAALFCLLAAAGCARVAPAAAARTFATPEDAVKALAESVNNSDVASLGALFGPDGQQLIDSSDPATARAGRQVFSAAFAEKWRLTSESPTHRTLVVGNEEWPFPVPLVEANGRWQFDTAAGIEEVVARRIGRNELAVIDTCHTYVTAQRVYAKYGHDGQPAGNFARAIRSDSGRQNGLYWPAKLREKPSPLGDLMTAAEGRGDGNGQQTPFYGYYYRILTAQGPSAPGGAKSYIVNGSMTGGFALIAWPAEYDVTGVMTFIVNQDGTVHEKNLGPTTAADAAAIAAYDPDASWQPAERE